MRWREPDLLPCDEVIDIGPFRFECQGHTPGHRRDGTVYPIAPYVHHSPRTRRDPGDVEITWYTESEEIVP